MKRVGFYLLAIFFCAVDYILSTAIDLGVRCAGFRFPPTGSIPDEYRLKPQPDPYNDWVNKLWVDAFPHDRTEEDPT